MPQIEIERKYVIRIPDVSAMRTLDGYSESEILQIYLDSPSSLTHRIRSRKSNGKVVYTETKKIRIDKMSAVEDERKITEEEFSRLSESIKQGTAPINKTRYTFTYLDNVFEVDVYPARTKTCILETELESRESKVRFPEFIELVAEVTGNKAYSNASMASAFPKELI